MRLTDVSLWGLEPAACTSVELWAQNTCHRTSARPSPSQRSAFPAKCWQSYQVFDMRILLAMFSAVILGVGTSQADEDWPRFRGPRGDGVSSATNLPLVWSETNNVAWKVRLPGRGRSSPILLGDEICWISDDGIACSADARSGQIHWQERLGGSYLASPVYADGRLYFCNQQGKTTVVRAGKQFEKLAENLVEVLVVATPAIADPAIFLRTDSHLYRIDKR